MCFVNDPSLELQCVECVKEGLRGACESQGHFTQPFLPANPKATGRKKGKDPRGSEGQWRVSWDTGHDERVPWQTPVC